MSKKRIAVYTAIFGGYDELKEPPLDPECDYFCFTDSGELRSSVFQIEVRPRLFSHPARDARYHKVLSHKVLSGYERTLWIDGSASFRFSDIARFVDDALRETPIAMPVHPADDDIYAELVRCKSLTKDDAAVMEAQVSRYRTEGYPEKSGLVSSGVIVRRSSDPRVQELECRWWDEIEKGSYRDQLSFNYVAWKLAVPCGRLDVVRYVPNSNPEFVSKHFQFWLHSRRRN